MRLARAEAQPGYRFPWVRCHGALRRTGIWLTDALGEGCLRMQDAALRIGSNTWP